MFWIGVQQCCFLRVGLKRSAAVGRDEAGRSERVGAVPPVVEELRVKASKPSSCEEKKKKRKRRGGEFDHLLFLPFFFCLNRCRSHIFLSVHSPHSLPVNEFSVCPEQTTHTTNHADF